MVDVSTAYCNCDLAHIEEKIYEAPANPRGMVELCQWIDPEIINSPEVTRKMIGNRPNTYTYTKVRLYDRAGLTVAGACRELVGQREHWLARRCHEAEHCGCQLEGT